MVSPFVERRSYSHRALDCQVVLQGEAEADASQGGHRLLFRSLKAGEGQNGWGQRHETQGVEQWNRWMRAAKEA
ncbi:hypothetical protein ASF22_08235 [Methylobacterium sp. Leaf87]|nr:hypothetical protein ASF22_08235 [Methylobacterium sp. Leaf87]KQP60904.1 hypothetical protein ASF52_07190 [Methylobacterium sp. Leaf112]